MAVSASSALVSSFAGLRGLALAAGWGTGLSALLPLTVDSWALAATRVWLTASTIDPRLRRLARRSAVGAVGLSLIGNATYHALSAGLIRMSWLVVVVVGAVPPVVLGLVTHLFSLWQQDGRDDAVPVPSPVLSPEAADEYRTQSRTEDELLAAARGADEAYRAAHGGRPITRDALRRELRVGGARAGELLRRVKAEGQWSGG